VQGLRSTRLQAAAAAALPVALAAWIYFPITRAYFYADDFTNLVSIVNDGFLPFVLRPFGGHNLLVRNLAFYGSFRLFGLRADLFFWTVLLTYLLDVWLLFRILRNLTGSLTLACFGAILWGTSPVNDGTLAWYSVYGQVLATTILLLVLERVTAWARAGGAVDGRRAAVWYGLLLLGTVCFGVGVGVALVFPAVLFLLLPQTWRQPRIRAAYLALPLVTIAIYFAFRRLYPLVWQLPPEEAYMAHGFPQLHDLAAMTRELLIVSITAALGSFAVFSRGLLPPAAPGVILPLFAAGVVVLLWRGDSASRRAGAAMLLLALGVYFVIASGRAQLVGLAGGVAASAAQRRYHFVGAIPIVILACLALQQVGRLGPLRRLPRVLLLVMALGLWTWAFRRAAFVVHDNAPARGEFQAAVRAIAVAVEARPPGTTVYIDTGQPTNRMLGMVMQKRDFPGRAAVFLLTQPGDEMDGRRVRFVERDPAVRAWYAARAESRLARLLVDPQAASSNP
jgi:hypothetical protein